jgi:signal transduction histidine kinase/DNA-binding response OmpR family regulator
MKKLLPVALLLLPILCFAQTQKHRVLDSLLKENASGKHYGKSDTNTIKLICHIGKEYLNANLPDSAIKYANGAMHLSEKRDYAKGQGWAYELLANANYDNHETALKYFFLSLKIFEEAKDDISKASVLYKTGGIYFNEEKYDLALDYFNKALRIYQNANDSRNIARVTHSIAGTYGNIGDHPKLLEYEHLALKEFEKSGQWQSAAVAYSNIGHSYSMLKRYNEALLYIHKGLRMHKAAGSNNKLIMLSTDQLASIYLNIALDSTTVLHGDSLLQVSRGANLQKAIQYYNEAYNLYPDDPYIDLLENWSLALKLSGRYKEALEKYTEYVELRDSFLSRDKLLQVSAEETKREAYLKENQIKLNEIQAANKKKERLLFIVSIGLLAFVAVLISRNNKKQKQTNLALENANIKLAKEKVKLEDANEQIAGEKEKSDQLAIELQESIVQKDAYAGQLSIAADMKTRFLANISHELRTPVTLLTGMLELMKNGNADNSTKTSERLSVAYNNSRKLQHMVEEILDLSRLENKVSQINTEAKEILPVIKRMVYAFETFIESEHLVLEFKENNCQDTYINIDENKLEKVVNNLIYNAIKFNKRDGHIKVDLSVSADKQHFIFSINNSGAIISPEDLPHIFERFYQANTKTAKAEGVGIGLSLVKEFTLIMGGTVDVESKVGKGTTFTLQFPVVEATVAEKPVPEDIDGLTEVWEHFPELQTVLIVEDNTEMRYYLKEVLQGKVNLAEAPNGKKALEWLANNKADLIISDMMMPEMGGEELVKHLKNDRNYRTIPVITLTALNDTGSRSSMLSLGIDDYIVKPFNASELRVRVYNLLNNLEERRKFEMAPVEEDDISLESKEAELFKEKIKEFVLTRMKTIDVSVYDLAYELSMSERQLYRLSKKLTGCTPAQLIKEVRLQKAYELLLGGTVYKLDDVARQIGFEDSNYFSRQFYERFGKRPSEFL